MGETPVLWPKILTLSVKDFGGDKGHWGLKLGHTYRLMGDSAHARAFGDTAVAAFEAQLRDFPDRAQLRVAELVRSDPTRGEFFEDFFPRRLRLLFKPRALRRR